jgi:hypothetical protein
MKEAKELLPGGVNSPGASQQGRGSEVSGAFPFCTGACWEHTREDE